MTQTLDCILEGLLSQTVCVESEHQVEEQAVCGCETGHGYERRPRMHLPECQARENAFRIQVVVPDHAVPMPKLILHDRFVGVLEDGHIVQPDPVLWNGRPTPKSHTTE